MIRTFIKACWLAVILLYVGCNELQQVNIPQPCFLPDLQDRCPYADNTMEETLIKIFSVPCPEGSVEVVNGISPFMQKLCIGAEWMIEVAHYMQSGSYTHLLEDGSLLLCNPRGLVDDVYPLVVNRAGVHYHLLSREDLACLEDGVCVAISQVRGFGVCL